MQRVFFATKNVSIFRNFLATQRNASTKSIGIIGVPLDKGASKRGVNLGPKAIREAGLIDEIKTISQNLDIKDYGDVKFESSSSSSGSDLNLKYLTDVAGCNKALADGIEQILNDGRMPISLGGDHSMAIGTISGVTRKYSDQQLGVLWVDAHIDLNTNETSPSGNMQ